MNQVEARAVLSAELGSYRARSYEELLQLIDDRRDYPVAAPSGVVYQMDVQAFWDDPDKPNSNLRVTAAIDDGGASAYAPMCDSFIIAPNGRFIGE